MGMATEPTSSRRQQTGKTEALCRAGNISSHKHGAMKTAGTEQLPPFPRTHSHPLTQAESAETNGPENASHLSLCLRSVCCLSIYTHIVTFQQRADHWACCCLSLSQGHLTVIQKRPDPGHGHLMFGPPGDWPQG